MQYSEQINVENAKSILLNIFSNPSGKGICALVSMVGEWLIGAHKEAFVVVFILIILDTLSGVMKAMYNSDVHSSGFFRFVTKTLVYFMLMVTAALVDKALPFAFGATIMYTFLAVTEGISILENISASGWPVPYKLLKVLKNVNEEEIKRKRQK